MTVTVLHTKHVQKCLLYSSDLADEHSVVLVYFLSGALIFTIILLLILSYAALTINIKMKRQSSGRLWLFFTHV